MSVGFRDLEFRDLGGPVLVTSTTGRVMRAMPVRKVTTAPRVPSLASTLTAFFKFAAGARPSPNNLGGVSREYRGYNSRIIYRIYRG